MNQLITAQRGIYCCIAAVLLIMAGCKGKEKTESAAAAPKPAVMRANGWIVGTTALSDDVEVSGTLVANEAAEIHPEVSGRIVYLNLPEGRTIAQGTVIARLEDDDLQVRLKKLQVQLKMARVTEERQGKLLAIESIPKQDYDAALLNVQTILADMEILKTDIAKTIIRAPFSGRLGLKNISKGAYITPATNITFLYQVNRMKLDFQVPEKYTGSIRLQQAVYFYTPGNTKKYVAQVAAVNPMVGQANRSLTVRAVVQNNDANLLPGAFARVELRFEPEAAALMVPTQAVIPQARGKKVVVYRDGFARFTDITTGLRDTATVQVTSGLKAGDTVLVTGLLSIKPDAKVVVEKIVNGGGK